jgi:glycosyltransferase involved in cell wall biosynthesis
MKKLCFVATIPAAVNSFLKGHIRASAQKWSVSIVSHPEGAELLGDIKVRFVPLKIERKASPWRDLSAAVRLLMLFRRERFDLVHSIMPKTGLLAMLAGRLSGTPARMHTFTGQVWANRQGWQRMMLKICDRLVVALATHILVDSRSQLAFLISEGVLKPGQGRVIGHGSICGVDPERFRPDARVRHVIRRELEIPDTATVLLFMGRMNRDKGLLDLATAFAEIAGRKPDAVLLLVGAEEDVSFGRIQQICAPHRERLRRVGFTDHPERYLAAADILCLPSQREGFGQVIIEAAASGVPAVASRIYGITDAVEDGVTGLLVPAGDVAELTKALLALIDDQALRRKMALAAKQRTLALFASENITREQMGLYEQAMARPKTG